MIDRFAPRGAMRRATSAGVAAVVLLLMMYGGSATAAVETVTAERGTTIEAICRPLSGDMGPGGLFCIAPWISGGERRALLSVLAVHGGRGVRVGFEVPVSPQNRALLAQADAFGGAAFERTADESAGVTRAAAEALLDPSAADLLFDEVRVPKGGSVPVEVRVPEGAAELVVVASVDRPEGQSTLQGPGGTGVAPAATTAMARLYRVPTPTAGVWTITAIGEGRHRVRARAAGVEPVTVEMPAHAALGTVPIAARVSGLPEGSTVVGRLYGWSAADVMEPIAQVMLTEVSAGRYEGSIEVKENGPYAVEVVVTAGDGSQRLGRRGFMAGATPPVGFAVRPARRAAAVATAARTAAPIEGGVRSLARTAVATTTSTATTSAPAEGPSEVGISVLEVGPTEARPVLLLDGAAVSAEASPVRDEGAAWRVQEVAASVSAATEGVHTAELRVGDATAETWTFAVDLPTATRLRIVEVAPAEDWIEVEALVAGDVSGVVATDLDDGDREPLADEPVTLRAGERFVVHFGEGEDETDEEGDANGNGLRDLYTEGRIDGTDQAVLLERGDGRGGPEVRAVLDAVGWTDGTIGEDEAKDFPLLAEWGEWTGDPVPCVDGVGIARPAAGDANGTGDWTTTYRATPGRAAEDPLMGKRSAAGMLRIEEVGLWSDEAAWAEVVVAAGPVDVSVFALTDLDGDVAPLSAVPLVVQAGARLIVHWAFGEDEAGPDGWGDANGNGAVDLYMVGERPPSENSDELAVMLGHRVIDAVAWGPIERLSDTAALSPCGWPATARLDTPSAHATLARTAEAAAPASWKVSLAPSPGRPNVVPTAPAAGSVKIVALDPTGDGGDWTEIMAMSGPVDVSRFTLTDLDGDDPALAVSPLTLRQGERARVHWTLGTDETDDVGDMNQNGIRDIYLDDGGELASTDDQLILRWDRTVFDAVVWTNGDGSMNRDEQKDLKALVDAGYWRSSLGPDLQKAAVPVGLYRLPIARTDPTQDSDAPGDWESVRQDEAQ